MTVGWYVHHHGDGHRSRLAAAREHLDGVVSLGSLGRPSGAGHVELPLDLDDAPRDPTAGGTLHWAPLGHPGLRTRMAQIAAWIAAARPQALVVDVSVEVALLGRLLGVPTVLIAQRGDRWDPPHALAYAQAAAIVAPWTAGAAAPGEPLPVGRTHHVGAISRLDAAFAARPAGPAPTDDVLVLLGAGGHAVAPRQVAAAAEATPERTWHVAGPLAAAAPNVVTHGPAADVETLLRRCAVVVGSAGGNVVAEVAAARRAYVCLPQARPFAEQERQGEALAALGVAECSPRWPEAARWPKLLAAAQARDVERWALLHDGRGAARLADVVRAVVRAQGEPARRDPAHRGSRPAPASWGAAA